MTTNLRQLMREMTEGYRFKKRMSNEEFEQLIEPLKRQIESTRESELLTAEDYAITINCTGEAINHPPIVNVEIEG